MENQRQDNMAGQPCPVRPIFSEIPQTASVLEVTPHQLDQLLYCVAPPFLVSMEKKNNY